MMIEVIFVVVVRFRYCEVKQENGKKLKRTKFGCCLFILNVGIIGKNVVA
jgi:hypothetical protein